MTVAIPESPEQLEEMFADEARMQNVFAEGNFGRFTHAYMKMFTAKHEDDGRQFKEKLQADFADFMRKQSEQNNARPAGDWADWKPGMGLPSGAAGRGPRRARAIARSRVRDAAEVFDSRGLFSATALGAAEDIDNSEYTDNIKHFVWAVLKGEHVARQGNDPELLDKLQALKGGLADALKVRNASMSERIPSEGGFLVPETLRSEMLALSLEDAVMRPEATVVPMDSLRVPFPAIDDTSHETSVFGGVTATWTAEGAALTSTAPSFGRLVLIASKLTAFTQIPNELLQDSATPMDVWFRTFFPQAMSFFGDVAFLVGDGVDEPEGLLNCPGAVTVNPAVSAQIALTDCLTMLCRLWPPSLKRARWVTSPDGLGQLLAAGLVVTSNGITTGIAPPALLTGMQAIEAPMGSKGDGFNFSLLGLPLRVSEKIPFPGGSGAPLALYDPSSYLIGDRQAAQVASSTEFAFANDMVSYRITERLDGRGWQRTPLQPFNGGSPLSMIVLLGQTS